jgi:hypothetical protein
MTNEKTNYMKLVIVTAVEEFEKYVLKLFKKANIESFSSSEIDDFKQHHGKVKD